MMKVNKALIIYIVLIIIFVGGLISVFSTSGPKTPRVISSVEGKEIRDLMSVEEDHLDIQSNVQSKGNVRNPFVITDSKEGNGFRFLGVFWGSETPSVIVNNKIYGIGDSVDGMLITQIKDGEVVLTDESGEHKVLSMKDNSPLTDPSVIPEDVASTQTEQKDPKLLPLNKRKPNRLPRPLISPPAAAPEK